jgi:hypothetical protein
LFEVLFGAVYFGDGRETVYALLVASFCEEQHRILDQEEEAEEYQQDGWTEHEIESHVLPIQPDREDDHSHFSDTPKWLDSYQKELLTIRLYLIHFLDMSLSLST